MFDMSICNFTDKEKVFHQLFLRAYSVKSPGLLYGKLGIAISLFDYAKRSGNTLFGDFGEELIDGILDDVGHKTGFDFATGLPGIAWGIEYLVQRGFVECDTNTVCAEIDKRMERICIHRMHDLSLETGLEGLLHYILIRTKGACMKGQNGIFSSDFMEDMSVAINNTGDKTEQPASLAHLADSFNAFHMAGKEISYHPDVRLYIKAKAFSENVSTARVGLRNGLAGWLYSF